MRILHTWNAGGKNGEPHPLPTISKAHPAASSLGPKVRFATGEGCSPLTPGKCAGLTCVLTRHFQSQFFAHLPAHARAISYLRLQSQGRLFPSYSLSRHFPSRIRGGNRCGRAARSFHLRHRFQFISSKLFKAIGNGESGLARVAI